MIGEVLDLSQVSDALVLVFDFVGLCQGGDDLDLFFYGGFDCRVQYFFLLLVFGGWGWVFWD